MKILKNFGYNLFYQLLTMVLPIITIPYISRVLGVGGVGEYAFTSATTQYFILFGMIGIKLYGSRTIAQVNNEPKKVKDTFWQLYGLQILFTLGSYILYTLLFSSQINSPIYFAQSFLVAACIFDISWLFTGLENFQKIVTRDTAVKIIGLIAIFILVKQPDDLIIYAFILSLTMFFGQLSMWFRVTKIVGKPKFNWGKTKKHLKPTFLLFLPQIASSVYMILDRTMIGLFTGVDDVGMYDQAQKIIRVTLAIVPALSAVMMPRIASMIVQRQKEQVEMYMAKSGLFIIIISVGVAFGLAGVAKNFVPWFYGDAFLDVINVFYLSVWLVIAVGGANLFAIQYLIPSNQQNKYTVTVVVAAIANIILNIVLLPTIGFYGAAIATVVAEFIGVGMQIYYVHKQLDVKKILRPLPKTLISGMIMLVVTYWIGTLFEPTILSTIIQVIVGGIIYLVLLVLLKIVRKSDLKLQ